MFSLHETTRRRVCRIAFFALCVAPTLATAAWVVDRRLPSRAVELAVPLESHLKLRCALVGLCEPRPRVVQCDAVLLRDPQSSELVVRLRRVKLQRKPGGLVARVEEAFIDANRTADAVRSIGHWLAAGRKDLVELRIERVTMSAAGGLTRLDNLEVRVEPKEDGRKRLRLVAHRGSAGSERELALRIEVEREQSGKIHYNVEASSLAAPLLAILAPCFAGLNADSNFSGTVQGELAIEGEGAFTSTSSGRLERLNLARLLPVDSPHAIDGVADVELTALSMRGQKIETLVGTATADEVRASRSMVDAAARLLYCRKTSTAAPAEGKPDDMLLISRLALKFQVDARGLTLSGAIPPGEGILAGAIATSGRETALVEPPYVEIPLGAWVHFAAGDGPSYVPATQSAVRAAVRLPLP